jgi:hypothetical protein
VDVNPNADANAHTAAECDTTAHRYADATADGDSRAHENGVGGAGVSALDLRIAPAQFG